MFCKKKYYIHKLLPKNVSIFKFISLRLVVICLFVHPLLFSLLFSLIQLIKTTCYFDRSFIWYITYICHIIALDFRLNRLPVSIYFDHMVPREESRGYPLMSFALSFFVVLKKYSAVLTV